MSEGRTPDWHDESDLADWGHEIFEQRLDERRENCVCPICGDGEWHDPGCEIGELEAEIAQLREDLDRARAGERESCAQICEARAGEWRQSGELPGSYPPPWHKAKAIEAQLCADAIRAEGD